MRHFRKEFFRLKMNFKKKESDVADEPLPDWVKVDKKDLIGYRIKLKCSKIEINLLYQEGVVIVLMLMIHTD